MRVVNRTAVGITAGAPYLEWTRQHDADVDKGALTVTRALIFEFQLASWTEDEARWPKTRDAATLREWFRIDIHSTVVDAGEDDLCGEEL